jgi:hypothetical protein
VAHYAADIERTVRPSAADEFALKRWAAHGYETDLASLGDAGSWTQLNERDLIDVEQPVLPEGFRFRTADEAGPKAAVQAHLDAWAPSTYTAEGYEGVRQTAAYRGDLHILVEAPDGTTASSTIMWLDEANKTAEFEPVGTHPGYRRLGLGTGNGFRWERLHEVHLRAAGLVVNQLVAGRAVPAGFYWGAACVVAWHVSRVGVVSAPVRQQAEGACELLPLGGQLVGRPRGPLGVEPGYQQGVAFEPLEPLGQDVRRDTRDLAEQLVEPARAGEQGLHHQQAPPVTHPGQRLGER